MAESVGGIWYEVDARTQGLLDAERQVDRSTRRMERSFDRTDQSVRRVSSSLGELKSIVTAVGGALAVQQVVRYADAWTNLQNQLRQVTETENERARVTQQLMGIANETRSGIDATANLYARLTRASTELGLSEQRRLRITRTINQAFAVSGATAQEASAAITQLSQGLAAGALRGDEFNSVAEQAPMIMRAIADEAKMTIGELREFAATGGITADLVVRALEGAADAMDTKFAKAAKSFGQNMEVANNNLTEFIGTSRAVSTVVTEAGETLVFFSENIDDIARLAGLAATAIGVRLVQALTASIARQAAATLGASSLAAAYSTMGARAATTAAAVRGLNAAMSLVGGPAGVAVLAAAAMVMYSDELTGTASQARRTADRVDELTNAINMNSEAAVRAGIVEMTAKMFDLEQQAIAARERIKEVSTGDTGPGFLGAAPGRTGEQVRAIQDLGRIQEEKAAANKAAERLQKAMEVIRGGSAVEKVDSSRDTLDSGAKGAKKAAEDAFDPIKALLDLQREYSGLVEDQRSTDEQALATLKERLALIQQAQEAGVSPGAGGGYDEQRQRARDAALSGGPDPLTGGIYDDQFGRYQQDQEAEEERYANQLELLRQAREQQLITHHEYNQREQQAAQQHADRLIQIEQAKNSLMLSTSSSLFGEMASLAQGFAGEQSGIYRAMFAASKAFAIADAAIKIQQGIANAAALPFPANLPAMASVAAATGSILSSIQSVTLAGGRQYGGGVSAGKGYRVTEDGKPELLTQGTQQYLIPGRSGKVTANKDMGGSGEVDVSVQIVNNGTAKTADAKVQRLTDRKFVIQVMQEDLQSGDKRSYTNQFAAKHGLNRKGT